MTQNKKKWSRESCRTWFYLKVWWTCEFCIHVCNSIRFHCKNIFAFNFFFISFLRIFVFVLNRHYSQVTHIWLQRPFDNSWIVCKYLNQIMVLFHCNRTTKRPNRIKIKFTDKSTEFLNKSLSQNSVLNCDMLWKTLNVVLWLVEMSQAYLSMCYLICVRWKIYKIHCQDWCDRDRCNDTNRKRDQIYNSRTIWLDF